MIEASNLGVRFMFDRQRHLVTSTAARFRRGCTETWGLRGVSFSLTPGQGVALLGGSGSGKTTLLRLISGIYQPDEGTVTVRGAIASLLSTQAGVLSALTGRENALLLGVLAGMSRRRSRELLETVKDQSHLADYFERPVGSFSQGMRARLGLTVADQINPSILLLDEVHEALDHEFRAVLERRGHEILAAGGIVIAAGHDHEMLSRLCDRALWLRNGTLRAVGPFDEVRETYIASV